MTFEMEMQKILDEIAKEDLMANRKAYQNGHRFRGDYVWHHDMGDDTQHFFFSRVDPQKSIQPEVLRFLKKIRKRSLGIIQFSSINADGTAKFSTEFV